MWQNDLVIALYLCALITVKKYSIIGGEISLWGFIVFILVVVLGVPLHMKRSSPLIYGQKRISEFNISGVNGNIKIPVSLIAYEQAIEIKLYFDSILVPYSMIVSEPVEVGKLVKSIRLTISVPGLPKVLTIHGNKKVREELSQFIRSRMTKIRDDFPRE
jgi:hypothetical protein